MAVLSSGSAFNTRPVGLLDFPPPAGGEGGGRFNVSLDLGSWSPQRKGKGGVRKLVKNHFESFWSFVWLRSKLRSPGVKIKKNPARFFDDKIINFKGRATILIPSCFSRQGASNHI